VWKSGSRFVTDVPYDVDGRVDGHSMCSYIMSRISRGRRKSGEDESPSSANGSCALIVAVGWRELAV
jgi:hypothetical protein